MKREMWQTEVGETERNGRNFVRTMLTRAYILVTLLTQPGPPSANNAFAPALSPVHSTHLGLTLPRIEDVQKTWT